MLRVIPHRFALCQRPRTPETKFIYLTIPAFYPQPGTNGYLISQRLEYWNRHSTEMALKSGWKVVDVFEYSKANSIDTILIDKSHCKLPGQNT